MTKVTNIKQFFKKNKKGTELVTFTLPNFPGAEFKIKVLTAGEAENVNKLAMVTRTGRKGKQTTEFDTSIYNREMCIRSLVEPDLDNAELQESYGCMGSVELFNTMFNWGEQMKILEKITESAGIEDINEEIENAKN